MSFNQWNESKLDDVCLKITDGSHTSPPSVEKGFYMASVKDMDEYGFIFGNCRMISEIDYLKLVKNGCQPQCGDVLIGKDGARYLEDIFVFKQDTKVVLLSSIAILRSDKTKVISEFLYYFLKDKNTRIDIKNNYGSGSAIPRMVLKDFKRVPIPVPPIPVQKAIANTLSSLDDKIELDNRMNKTLEEMAQVIFKSWFVDYEPFQDGEFEYSELGSIPKGWRVSRVGDVDVKIFDYVANGSFASLKQNVRLYEDINYAYFIRNVDLKANLFGKYVDKHSYDFLSKTKLFGNEVIISNVGDVGSVFLCPVLSKPMTLGNNMIMLTSAKNTNYNFFMYILFKHLYGRELIQSITGGSAQPKFNKTDFRNLKITLPAEDVVDRFNKIIEKIFEKINGNIQKIEVLTTIRDSLIPKLMSGEIRVPTEEAQ